MVVGLKFQLYVPGKKSPLLHWVGGGLDVKRWLNGGIVVMAVEWGWCIGKMVVIESSVVMMFRRFNDGSRVLKRRFDFIRRSFSP